jgi:hypothetical protein
MRCRTRTADIRCGVPAGQCFSDRWHDSFF